MRPLQYSINVTLGGCCDHRAIVPDEDLHRHAVENLDRADALLFGRVTYEMMEAAFRPPAVVMSAAASNARPEYAAFLVQRYLPMDRSTDIPGPGIRTILTPVLIFL